ncbi:MAG: tyrosine-type recombinase/integrase [Pseudomonadota bacterium]
MHHSHDTTARDILLNISPQGSPYLFPGKNRGKRIEVRRFMTRIRKIANLPKDFRPLHGLRHTYASWLASSGKVDLFILQKLLTHGSPQMTQRYAHLADEAVKRAASVIDECLDSRPLRTSF